MRRFTFIAAVLSLLAAFLLTLGCTREDDAEWAVTGTRAAAPELGVIATVGPTATRFAGGTSRYENSQVGFAFDYPDYWEQPEVPIVRDVEVGEENIIVRVVLAENTSDLIDLMVLDGIMVTVSRLGVNVAGEDVEEVLLTFDDLYAQLLGQTGGVIRQKDWGELGGWTARRYVMDFTMRGKPTTSETLVTVLGDEEFEIACQAKRENFEEVRDGCQIIFDSFEFLPVAAN